MIFYTLCKNLYIEETWSYCKSKTFFWNIRNKLKGPTELQELVVYLLASHGGYIEIFNKS